MTRERPPQYLRAANLSVRTVAAMRQCRAIVPLGARRKQQVIQTRECVAAIAKELPRRKRKHALNLRGRFAGEIVTSHDLALARR